MLKTTAGLARLGLPLALAGVALEGILHLAALAGWIPRFDPTQPWGMVIGVLHAWPVAVAPAWALGVAKDSAAGAILDLPRAPVLADSRAVFAGRDLDRGGSRLGRRGADDSALCPARRGARYLALFHGLLYRPLPVQRLDLRPLSFRLGAGGDRGLARAPLTPVPSPRCVRRGDSTPPIMPDPWPLIPRPLATRNSHLATHPS